MRNRFDKELDLLNNEIIEMGNMIETSIENAVKALINQDVDLAKMVILGDINIDEQEKEIERRCLRLLLQQHPVASDLRLISSALKMITDMERIGDQASDISELTIRLAGQKYIKEISHIPQMAKNTIKMVKDSIEAFISGDLSLADSVIAHDDIVDELFNLVKNELIHLIREDAHHGEQAIDLIMIAKYFERIGDHAENIAEWVVFSITGEHINSEF